MMSFRNRRLRDHTLSMSTAWLVNDIAEVKGKQELFTRQSPQVLKALREAAIIQSAESFGRDMLRYLLNRLRQEKRLTCVKHGRNSLWQKM